MAASGDADCAVRVIRIYVHTGRRPESRFFGVCVALVVGYGDQRGVHVDPGDGDEDVVTDRSSACGSQRKRSAGSRSNGGIDGGQG